ncbi:MAG: hypothetical protein IMZ53_08180 [Thermoplasmata archaeon]|nr:hypothetical protein [Thermoplasmata archaeon]
MLPWSGHPPGFYMANRIWDQQGRETLVRGVGDPFSFFSLYKTAEENSGENRAFLSAATINVVLALSISMPANVNRVDKPQEIKAAR